MVAGDKRGLGSGLLTGGGPRRVGWTVLVLLVTSAAAALVLSIHYHLGVPATLVALLVGGGTPPGLFLAWATYRDGRPGGAPNAHADLSQLADQLAAALKQQWQEEANARLLNDPYPLPISWDAAEPSLADDWRTLQELATTGYGWPPPPPRGVWAARPRDLAGSGRELATALGRVPTGRLVVLGEPGAGKTALMVRLVLDLLARRQPGGQVPVLVSIATWDPRAQGLNDWLEARLTTDYPALAAPPPAGGQRTSVQALLAAGLILPLLDALDEIPAVTRATALVRIADELKPGQQIVLTCRTGQYREMVTRAVPPTLHAAVVQLRPLDARTVSRYLRADAASRAAQERWAPVLRVLGSEKPVARALTKPLMVSLARTIYSPRRGEYEGELRDPAELLDASLDSQEAVESHLFDAFVAAAYRRPGPAGKHHWDARQARKWLTFLAAHLEHAGGVPDLEWWQLRTRACRLIGGLCVGAVSFLMFGLAGWLAGGREYGTGYGLAYAAAFGPAGFLSFAFGARLPPSRAEFRLRGTAWNFLSRFTVGILIAVIYALAMGQAIELPAGFTVGLSLGTYAWLNTPALTKAVPSPETTLSEDLSGTIGFAIAIVFGFGTLGGLAVGGSSYATGPLNNQLGVIVGVTVAAAAGAIFAFPNYGWVGAASYGVAGGMVGLLATAWDPPVSGLGAGIVFGLDFGVAIALASISSRAWGSFMICRSVLALQGHLPWPLLSFLADAHRRGVLRQDGAVYQFRHIELQQRLANGPVDR